MDLCRKVVLVLILYLASLSFIKGTPTKFVESRSKFLKALTHSDSFTSAKQRPRRQAESDSPADQDEDTTQDDQNEDPTISSEWVTNWMNQWRCPTMRTSSNRRTGYPIQTDYDYDGPQGGTDYGYGGSSNRPSSGNGYGSRRRYRNRWFDNRDDYADEILVYRFYNGGYRSRSGQGGNTQRGTGYQQGGRRQGERQGGGSRRSGSDTMLGFQGAKKVGNGSYGG